MSLTALRVPTRSMLCLATALSLTTQASAVPAATELVDGISFTEYVGSAPVGGGQVDDGGTLFFIDEKLIDGLKAWYIFHDGVGISHVTATLNFDAPIIDVLSDRDALQASAAYGSDSVRYVYHAFTGLEARQGDAVSFERGSRRLQLDFSTLTPGDHIRVLTAVPEPRAAALLVAGLATLQWLARRRRRQSL